MVKKVIIYNTKKDEEKGDKKMDWKRKRERERENVEVEEIQQQKGRI